MTLLNLVDIKKQYDIKKILDGISFSVNHGDRISIIGKNGAGKSTILRIVNGDEVADSGDRIVINGIDIKTLSQHPRFPVGISVREAIEIQLNEIYQALKEYEELSQKLILDFENQDLISRHSEISAFLDHHSAWNIDNKIEKVLNEFSLKDLENRSVNSLSGGEMRRVALAGLLLQKPDLLLLDEPTNHLDVYMVEFLENLIIRENYNILFISHDRYFIDKIATRTIEIDNGKIVEFSGGYQNYLDGKNLLLMSMQKQHEDLLKLLKQENEWFARGVKARLKRNEGRKTRLMDMRDRAKTNPSAIRKMKLELQREEKNFQQEQSVNRQKMLFELNDLSKSLGGKKLIYKLNLRIVQKDRIAIVGRNGTGKSTLLKILLSKLEADSGTIKRGEFEIGYFDQHREILNDDKNLIETFCPHGGDRVDVRGSNMHVFGYLKQFLFPKEFLDKKIGLLSGGEKNRVALALLFTKKIDCLILDEPTNDLDIATINILEEQLNNFHGAIIFVSHDRYFVDKIAKKLLIFKGNGEIEESYQTYSEYLDFETELAQIDEMITESEKEQNNKIIIENNKNINNNQKLSFKEKQILEKHPQKIELLEKEINNLKKCLSEPKCYENSGIVKLSDDLLKIQKECDKLIEELLIVEEKVENLK